MYHKVYFQMGAILDLTCDDLERSITLDDENIPASANCNNTIFSNLAQTMANSIWKERFEWV